MRKYVYTGEVTHGGRAWTSVNVATDGVYLSDGPGNHNKNYFPWTAFSLEAASTTDGSCLKWHAWEVALFRRMTAEGEHFDFFAYWNWGGGDFTILTVTLSPYQLLELSHATDPTVEFSDALPEGEHWDVLEMGLKCGDLAVQKPNEDGTVCVRLSQERWNELWASRRRAPVGFLEAERGDCQCQGEYCDGWECDCAPVSPSRQEETVVHPEDAFAAAQDTIAATLNSLEEELKRWVDQMCFRCGTTSGDASATTRRYKVSIQEVPPEELPEAVDIDRGRPID